MAFTFPKDSTNKAGAVRATTDGNNFYVPAVIFGPDGMNAISTTNPAPTRSMSVNTELVANATLSWDGIKLFDTLPVPVTMASAIFIKIDNSNQSKDLTVTVELEVTTGVWLQWYDAGGYEISFTVAGSSKRVYGGFPPFSKYLRARLKFTAAKAPITGTHTIVQVQEVA
ncbi:hypothetical protein [Paenibacillus sp. FSL H7-0331]|uniref:hypothetical protein n=1 Tax=Paenibacillus sp. FSL H7-0331 TaxID=1920421 RepID=UPI00096C699B|nr:hypothetical protein [Paenibacillus sp. FSL H7-0331]OMF12343.1 hypothetical protein BK127_23010 [Paenibacillus sp. FSL H7-0331]